MIPEPDPVPHACMNRIEDVLGRELREAACPLTDPHPMHACWAPQEVYNAVMSPPPPAAAKAAPAPAAAAQRGFFGGLGQPKAAAPVEEEESDEEEEEVGERGVCVRARGGGVLLGRRMRMGWGCRGSGLHARLWRGAPGSSQPAGLWCGAA